MIDLMKFVKPMATQASSSRQGAEALARMMGGTVPQAPDSITVTAPKRPPPAPVNQFGEFFTTLMGGKPDNGFQNNGVQSSADFLRKVMIGGSDASELDAARNDKIAANNTSQGKLAISGEKLQEAEDKDFEERAALLDPEYSTDYNTARTGNFDYNKAKDLKEAIATGDLEEIRKHDPKVADEIDKARGDRAAAADKNKLAAVNAAIQGAANTGAPFSQVLGQMNTRGLFTPEEVQQLGGMDPRAVAAMYGQSRTASKSFQDDEGIEQVLYDTGETSSTGINSRDPLADEATRANTALARANTAKANAEAEGDTAAGKQQLSQLVQRGLQNLALQKKINAGPVVGKDDFTKVSSYFFSTPIGQEIEKGRATPQQALRNEMNTIAPLLMTGIKNATGLSSTQLNSNVELQFYLKAVGDTTADIDSRIQALMAIDQMFGLNFTGGGGATAPSEMRERVATNQANGQGDKAPNPIPWDDVTD